MADSGSMSNDAMSSERRWVGKHMYVRIFGLVVLYLLFVLYQKQDVPLINSYTSRVSAVHSKYGVSGVHNKYGLF